MRTQVIAIALAAVCLTASPPARAQSTSVQAQSLFDEGRRLIKAGKIPEACAAFESSYKLDPAVTTLLNLADCRESNQQLATAWGAFVDANRMAKAAGNDKLAQVATNHARKLAPKLSKLTISIAPDRQLPGLEVLRGTEPVAAAAWNHALPIDGGTYTITARAPGHAPWSATRTIKPASDAQTIEVPRLVKSAPVAAAPPARAPTAPATASPGPTTNSPTSSTTSPPPSRPATSPASPPPSRSANSPASSTTNPPPGRASTSPASPAASAPANIDPRRAAPPSVAQAEAPPARGPLPPSGERSAGPSRVLPIALGAGALAFGGAAVGFHVWGNDFYDRAKQAATQAERDSLYSSANTRRYAAQGFAVAAVGCAGAAVYLLLARRGQTDTTALAPIVSPELAGVAVLGRW